MKFPKANTFLSFSFLLSLSTFCAAAVQLSQWFNEVQCSVHAVLFLFLLYFFSCNVPQLHKKHRLAAAVQWFNRSASQFDV